MSSMTVGGAAITEALSTSAARASSSGNCSSISAGSSLLAPDGCTAMLSPIPDVPASTAAAGTDISGAVEGEAEADTRADGDDTAEAAINSELADSCGR